MKRILLSVLLVMFGCMTTFVQAQNMVPRNVVVVEIATGTWCQFCPGSALGGDDLVHNGHDVAIIENHGGDSYEYPGSTSRNNLYNVSGWPTTKFDGTINHGGGSLNASIYNAYLPKYNTAIAKMSPYTMDLQYTRTGDDFIVTIDITQTAANSSTNPVVHLVWTESHIPANWFGLSEINFVNRAMYPTLSGTPLNLTVGQSTTVTLNFTADPSWERNDSELVAFIQDQSSKEIFQGDKRTLRSPDFQLDAAVLGFADPINPTLCADEMAPSILLRNDGADTLTSLEINYSINGGTMNTFNWTGTLPFYESETVTLPNIAFSPIPTNNGLNVFSTKPNGNTDNNVANDLIQGNWDNPSHVKGQFLLIIQPDAYGSEITWDMKDPNGIILASGGPYADGNTAQIVERVALGFAGCHEFNIYDSFGDGIAPSGYYEFRAPSGALISRGSDYGARDQAFTGVMENVAIAPLLAADAVQISPNPTSGLVSVQLTSSQLQDVNISVFQINGQRVLSMDKEDVNGSVSHEINLSGLSKGLYLVKITSREGIYTGKITLQ